MERSFVFVSLCVFGLVWCCLFFCLFYDVLQDVFLSNNECLFKQIKILVWFVKDDFGSFCGIQHPSCLGKFSSLVLVGVW